MRQPLRPLQGQERRPQLRILPHQRLSRRQPTQRHRRLQECLLQQHRPCRPLPTRPAAQAGWWTACGWRLLMLCSASAAAASSCGGGSSGISGSPRSRRGHPIMHLAPRTHRHTPMARRLTSSRPMEGRPRCRAQGNGRGSRCLLCRSTCSTRSTRSSTWAASSARTRRWPLPCSSSWTWRSATSSSCSGSSSSSSSGQRPQGPWALAQQRPRRLRRAAPVRRLVPWRHDPRRQQR